MKKRIFFKIIPLGVELCACCWLSADPTTVSKVVNVKKADQQSQSNLFKESKNSPSYSKQIDADLKLLQETISETTTTSLSSDIDPSSVQSPVDQWKLSEKHKKRLLKQQEILEKINSKPLNSGSYIKNEHALKVMTNNGVVVTEDTLQSFENDPENTELKMDLFDADNAKVTFLRLLHLILQHGYFGEAAEISKSDLQNLYSDISSDWANENEQIASVTQEEMEAEKCRKISEVLKKIYSRIENKHNTFAKFVYAYSKCFQVIAARDISSIICARYRDAADLATQQVSQTTSASVGVSGALAGGKLSGTVGVSKSTTGADAVFLSSSDTKSVSITFSIGNKIVSMNVGAGVSLTKGYVFGNALQLLDSGRIPKNWLLNESLRKMYTTRHGMQEEEATFGRLQAVLVAILKNLNACVPSAVSVVPFSITKLFTAASRTVSGNLNVGLSFLSSIGVSVSGSQSKKVYDTGQDALSYVDDSCYLIDGYNLATVKRELNSPGFASTIVSEVDAAILESAETKNAREVAWIHKLYSLRGELDKYIDWLGSLAAEKNSRKSKDLKNQKHDLEKRWVTSKVHKGRVGVLFSAIVTFAELRQYAVTAREIGIFGEIHNRLLQLKALCEFSKNKDHTTRSQRTMIGHDKSITFKSNLGEFMTGSIQKTESSGHPLAWVNGPSTSVNLSTPYAIAGLGFGILLGVMQKITGMTKNSTDSKRVDLSKIYSLCGQVGAGSILSCLGTLLLPAPIGISHNISVDILSKELTAHGYVSKLPLPGYELVEEPGTGYIWERVKVVPTLNTSVKVPLAFMGSGVSGSFSTSFGCPHFYINPDSLEYWQLKFGALSKTNLWGGFTKEHFVELQELFSNLTRTSSNAFWENQVMYNKIMTSKFPEKEQCTEYFSDLLTNCKKHAVYYNFYKKFVEFLSLYAKFSVELEAIQDKIVSKKNKRKTSPVYEKIPLLIKKDPVAFLSGIKSSEDSWEYLTNNVENITTVVTEKKEQKKVKRLAEKIKHAIEKMDENSGWSKIKDVIETVKNKGQKISWDEALKGTDWTRDIDDVLLNKEMNEVIKSSKKTDSEKEARHHKLPINYSGALMKFMTKLPTDLDPAVLAEQLKSLSDSSKRLERGLPHDYKNRMNELSDEVRTCLKNTDPRVINAFIESGRIVQKYVAAIVAHDLTILTTLTIIYQVVQTSCDSALRAFNRILEMNQKYGN